MSTRITASRLSSAAARFTVLLVAAVATSCIGGMAEANDVIPVNRVPANVRRVVASRVPGVRFSKAIHDQENGYFRLTGTDARGRAVRVVADGDAQFVQITVLTPVSSKVVPRSVMETHNQTIRGRRGRWYYTATTILRAEESILGDGAGTVLYEFLGKSARGELMRQVIREDGVNIGLGQATD